MINPGPNAESEVNQALVEEFGAQRDVKIPIQLPDYDDLRGFELAIDL